MRRLIIASLVVAQLATPAVAADLVTERNVVAQEAGAFAGARLRVPLRGTSSGPARAGFVMAPTLRTERSDLSSALRFGEGVELGLTRRGAASLSLAGRPLTGDEARRAGGPRAGISTLGWVAIGTGVVLVAGTLLFMEAMENSSE